VAAAEPRRDLGGQVYKLVERDGAELDLPQARRLGQVVVGVAGG
jgi:hypothetical protein